MKTRRTIQWLALGLVIPFLGGTSEAATPDAAGGSAARCTITIKAHLDPGALGKDGVTLFLRSNTQKKFSRVRIKGGTWSKLGDYIGWVFFNPDGTWKGPNAGTGEWSGQVQLNMGCRYRRRYEFVLNRWRSVPGAPHRVIAVVRPQYPSTSTWTRSQTIDLGNLARYF